MKKILNFALYDFANSAFTTIIITFIFSTYFATQIAPNPVLGQSYWGWAIGITGILVAIIGNLYFFAIAIKIPPFAVPSSLVIINPVIGMILLNSST